ncbi:hypothetical protein J5N97_002860 [Dioscorea zingiberensis]|uniref:Uncharacterized protein n=1 Tax=Dioscorea zingiberensis TaxID=325984 RepID=A0A9D5D4P8_9LILI|nr:hypothetical protein J5N97_002860 [Dioscorea zingiberensis]
MLVHGAFSTDVVLAGVGILLRDHSLKCALAMPVRTMSSLETEAAAIGTAVRLGIQHGILEMCIFSECKDAVEIFNREREGPAQVEALLSHWREESNLRHYTVYNCDRKYVTKADSLAKCAAREGKLARWDRREDNFPHDVGSALMDCTPSSPLPTHEFSGSDVYAWKAHILEVTACAWSPTDSLLASGSTDESVLIWKVSDDLSSIQSSRPSSDDLIVLHGQHGSISTLTWNGEGELLAIGTYDGQVLIRSKNGELKRKIDMYGKTLFSVAWNREGDFLLTGSFDRVIVTDTNTWECMLEYEIHPVLLGAEWRNNISFATYSTEKRIYVYDVSKSQPVKIFSGHQDGINAIRWDYSGTLLASCSNDGAVKIWTMEQDQSLHNLMHNEGVDSIRWSPNPNKHSVLASASVDTTIKIWDGNLGQVLYCFNGHREPVLHIEFSPDGEYLASGAEDGSLLIWKVKDGTIVKSFYRNNTVDTVDTVDTMVENISWNRGGNKLAAGYGDGVLLVIGSSKPILQCKDTLDDLVNDFLAKS